MEAENNYIVRILEGLRLRGVSGRGMYSRIAEKTGYTLSMVGKVLSGKVVMGERFIKVVCNAFGINEDWVLLGKEPIETIGKATHLNDERGNPPVFFEGKRLREVRESLGYSFEEMAQQLNEKTESLNEYENDPFIKDTFIFRKLALLGININWMMTGRGEMRLTEGPIIVSKQDAIIDSYGRRMPKEYWIDELFTTRLKRSLGKITPEWLSNETGIRLQKISNIMADKTIPSVDEIESIARALGNVNPAWLAEKSPIPKENWQYEYYRKDKSCSFMIELIRMVEIAIEECHQEVPVLKPLSPAVKDHVRDVLCRLHLKESPDCTEINKEMVMYIVSNADSWKIIL